MYRCIMVYLFSIKDQEGCANNAMSEHTEPMNVPKSIDYYVEVAKKNDADLKKLSKWILESMLALTIYRCEVCN